MSKTDHIMIAGDTHGDTVHVKKLIKRAAAAKVETIIVCGDFGIWTHSPSGHSFLDTINEDCRKHGIKIRFLGGNHENWDHLDVLQKINPRDYHGHVYIRSHVRFIPHGTVWTAENKRFYAVGGAVSIDKDRRLALEKAEGRPRSLWWDQEALTEKFVKSIEDAPPQNVDFMFTHDCPTNAPFRYRMKNDPDSHAHRQFMDRIGKAVRPKFWAHGHMHEMYEYEFPMYNPTTSVYGLECNGMYWSYGYLNVVTGKFTWTTSIEE